MKFYCDISNGKLEIFHKDGFDTWVQSHEGKFEITFTKPSNKRSIEQNRYLHALFTIFSKAMIEYTGDRIYTSAYMKDLCKTKFLIVDEVDPNTSQLIGQRVRHTSELNKKEIADFWEAVIQWAVETFNITLPFPGENLKLLLINSE